MTPEEIRRRMLDAIAGPESAGRYDIRYTPRGGATFTGFDKHPGIYEPGPAGPSSAAGRYQFVKSTWDRMGGGAFTPERQDDAAWRLAQQDYRARTGQDLVATIQKNGTLTPDVLKVLGPTWAGFKDNPSKALAAWNGTAKIQNRQFNGTGATPTPVVNTWNEPEGVPVMQTGATPATPKTPVTPVNGGPFFGEPEGIPAPPVQPDTLAGLLGGMTKDKGMGLLSAGASAMQKQQQAQQAAENQGIADLWKSNAAAAADAQRRKIRPFTGNWDGAGLLG